MANEISYTFQLNLSNGNLKASHSSGTITVNQASAKMVSQVQNIGTTEEALILGDVTTPGIAVFQNLDTTNFVEIGTAGNMFKKIKAGEQYLMRLTTTAPVAKANTAAVELFYIILQD